MSKTKPKAGPTTLKRNGKRAPVKTRARKSPSRLGTALSKLFAMLPVKVETIERAITATTVILIVGAVAATAIFCLY